MSAFTAINAVDTDNMESLEPDDSSLITPRASEVANNGPSSGAPVTPTKKVGKATTPKTTPSKRKAKAKTPTKVKDDEDEDGASPTKKTKMTPAKGAAKKGKTRPIPKCIEDADQVDKTLIEMKDVENSSWAEIAKFWKGATGENKPVASLVKRYARLKDNLTVWKAGDEEKFLAAKKAVESNWETKKWQLIADEMEGNGGDRYNIEAMQKKFRQLQTANPDLVLAAVAGSSSASKPPKAPKSPKTPKAVKTPKSSAKGKGKTVVSAPTIPVEEGEEEEVTSEEEDEEEANIKSEGEEDIMSKDEDVMSEDDLEDI